MTQEPPGRDRKTLGASWETFGVMWSWRNMTVIGMMRLAGLIASR
jgi:hypothetical protein